MPRQRLDYIYSEIGSNISNLRQKKGITQEELALQSGLKRTSIVLIEKGKQRVPVDRLYLIASSLKCKLVDILPEESIIAHQKEKSIFNSKFDEYSEQLMKKSEKNKLIEKLKTLKKEKM